jgi:hypothetical protein
VAPVTPIHVEVAIGETESKEDKKEKKRKRKSEAADGENGDVTVDGEEKKKVCRCLHFPVSVRRQLMLSLFQAEEEEEERRC